jgi:hypothetical protein
MEILLRAAYGPASISYSETRRQKLQIETKKSCAASSIARISLYKVEANCLLEGVRNAIACAFSGQITILMLVFLACGRGDRRP